MGVHSWGHFFMFENKPPVPAVLEGLVDAEMQLKAAKHPVTSRSSP